MSTSSEAGSWTVPSPFQAASSGKSSGSSPMTWKRESPLVDGLADPTAFYHVHSFAPVASNGVVLGTAEYGSEFVSAVAGDGVWGVQFHPEKSGPDGLTLLQNFLELAQ